MHGISVGDLWFLESKAVSRAMRMRSDWRSALDDLIAEAEMFGNEIPMSGDVRAMLIRGLV